jgi:hypothetical protein
MLVFATNQIKLFAVGGIRRGGHQPSGKIPVTYRVEISFKIDSMAVSKANQSMGLGAKK